jgi:hypothetical protein
MSSSEPEAEEPRRLPQAHDTTAPGVEVMGVQDHCLCLQPGQCVLILLGGDPQGLDRLHPP